MPGNRRATATTTACGRGSPRLGGRRHTSLARQPGGRRAVARARRGSPHPVRPLEPVRHRRRAADQVGRATAGSHDASVAQIRPTQPDPVAASRWNTGRSIPRLARSTALVASGRASKLALLSAPRAVAVGFEPTVVLPTHAFEACSFGRSDTPPSVRVQEQLSAASRRRSRSSNAPHSSASHTRRRPPDGG